MREGGDVEKEIGEEDKQRGGEDKAEEQYWEETGVWRGGVGGSSLHKHHGHFSSSSSGPHVCT